MPRPLYEPNNRNPTKIQNTFATPVGADLCVGPLHTCCFRARAHTQVRPYKATKQYGDIKHVRYLCRVEACLDRRSRKRAGRPSADRRSYLQPQTPSRASAKRPGVQGLSPCRSHKRAGAPVCAPAVFLCSFKLRSSSPARLRRAVRPGALPPILRARGGGIRSGRSPDACRWSAGFSARPRWRCPWCRAWGPCRCNPNGRRCGRE